MTIYCTRLTYLDNYLKNTYHSFIQKHRHVGNMLLLYFIVRGFFFCNMYHPLISSLTCLQIIEFYVEFKIKKKSCRVLIPDGIQVGTSVNKLKSYASPQFLFLLPWFFSENLFYISVWQLMIKTLESRYAIF